MAFHHIAMIRFKDEVGADARNDIEAGLRSLQPSISEIRGFSLGYGVAGANPSDPSFDLVITIDFDDQGAFDRYAAHPVHVELLTQEVLPAVADTFTANYTD